MMTWVIVVYIVAVVWEMISLDAVDVEKMKVNASLKERFYYYYHDGDSAKKEVALTVAVAALKIVPGVDAVQVTQAGYYRHHLCAAVAVADAAVVAFSVVTMVDY
ncbi:hypothetical protein BDC45DRAFT_513300 [Circinella umbellata]|nr:hypothetical protein BDC45DRAFT_513300 [Circinella umbellata]